MPVAICTVTGVEQIRRMHLSVGHGDNVFCTVGCLPQASLPPDNVTVHISDGLGVVQITGCRVDRSSIRVTTLGHVVGMNILGPTWKWKWGCISGVYNVRRPDGSVDPNTQKTVRELAELLFQAMQVLDYDVSALPAVPGPFVNWRGANALSELTWLTHTWGRDFGIDISQNSKAVVWIVGAGAQLPSGGADRTLEYGVDRVEPPDVLKVLCAPNLYQSKLKLEPVGIDLDGAIKHVKDLSYNPGGQGSATGWDGTEPENPDAELTDPEARALARRCYLKWWRVVSQADGSQDVPGYGQVSSIEDILPIFEYLSGDYQSSQGVFYRQRAFLSGVFEVAGEPRSLNNSDCNEPCEVEFTIDRELGIVKTATPVNKVLQTFEPVAADLHLTCSYYVRRPQTYDYASYSASRQIANNNTGDYCLQRPDLQLRFIAEYDEQDCTTVTNVTDNADVLDQQMTAQLDAAQSEFQAVGSQVREYAGIVPIANNGATRSTAYLFHCDEPKKGLYTLAARNTEWEPGLPRRRQRFVNALGARGRAIREIQDAHRRRLERRGEL